MGKPDWLSFRATRRVLGLAMLRQTFWASAGVASSRSAMCSFLLSLTGWKTGADAFAVICDAMRRTNRVALAKIVI